MSSTTNTHAPPRTTRRCVPLGARGSRSWLTSVFSSCIETTSLDAAHPAYDAPRSSRIQAHP
ncbi:hypothetical protein DB32_007467 [Sandaracinus amylolyticus]|uniref:Uncharacterized protein n=1 Tax=Sandaracinus amylolyticus TaxID=927083 RepID=A0A0F6W8P5_9BACT|nr:hypothetical protein DB32_007467 [Sandaracinus amylolyticus]